MPSPVTVFQYSRCGTCKNALRWLRDHDVEFHEVDIVQNPPTVPTLRKALRLSGAPLKRLFNTSGQSYREGNFKERLATLSETEALEQLAQDGKLIKRPLVLVGDDLALIGFQSNQYEQAFVR